MRYKNCMITRCKSCRYYSSCFIEEGKSMIPKVIHYVWVGGKEKPTEVKNCIESWKRYCPDYKIKEWNESNFYINGYRYVAQAYEQKKWAFVSDVIRLFALYTEGGIYLDTDVELFKNLDVFLDNKAFTGFENTETNTMIISDILEKNGIDRNRNELQETENITIYPKNIFCPNWWENGIPDESYARHLMLGSWG